MYPLNPAKADYSVNKVYRIHFSIVRRATGTGQSALWSQFAGRKRDGLVAPEPAHGFLAEVLALAAAARRGYGEERILARLWQRLEQKENPAQRARRVRRGGGGAGAGRFF